MAEQFQSHNSPATHPPARQTLNSFLNNSLSTGNSSSCYLNRALLRLSQQLELNRFSVRQLMAAASRRAKLRRSWQPAQVCQLLSYNSYSSSSSYTIPQHPPRPPSVYPRQWPPFLDRLQPVLRSRALQECLRSSRRRPLRWRQRSRPTRPCTGPRRFSSTGTLRSKSRSLFGAAPLNLHTGIVLIC